MFVDTTFKKMTISEKEKMVGRMEINMPLVSSTVFMRPFIRNLDYKMVTKLGNRDYQKQNQFIIQCMQDYYDKLMSASSNTERTMMQKTYQHLYEMWRDLHNAQKSNNLVELDKIYDLFSYELYVLGYVE